MSVALFPISLDTELPMTKGRVIPLRMCYLGLKSLTGMSTIMSRLQMLETPFNCVLDLAGENYTAAIECGVVGKCNIFDRYCKLL